MDGDRLEQVWRKHADAVHAYAVRRIGHSAADDVVIEVFMVALRREEPPEVTLPWLLGVAHNVVRHQHRSDGRRVRRESAVAHDRTNSVQVTTVSDAERTDHDGAIEAALRQLPPLELEAIRLVAWEQLTAAEAAVVVGCTPVAFRVRLHRARRRIARQLATKEVVT